MDLFNRGLPRLAARLSPRSFVDPTGLPSYSEFFRVVQKELAGIDRSERVLTLLQVSIGPWAVPGPPGIARPVEVVFKKDGKRLGDVVQLLRQASDLVTHVNSGEFVLMLSRHDAAAAARIGNGLRAKIGRLHGDADDDFAGGLPLLTPCIGAMSSTPHRRHTAEAMLVGVNGRAREALPPVGEDPSPPRPPRPPNAPGPPFEWPDDCVIDHIYNHQATGSDEAYFFRAQLQTPRTVIWQYAASFEEADRAAFAKLRCILACPSHEFDAEGCPQGAAVCGRCGMFKPAEPIT